jgi:RNA polymerase sigma-70 factor (ECF subfamily)
MANDDSSFRTRHADFHTTRWSIVIGAQGRSARDPDASLESLCQQYWPPLYAYVRRCGHSRHDSQDLTQEFFARLLEKDWLAAVEPARGRLRSFLLMAMKRFLANEWDRSRTLKRGGGTGVVSLDAEEGEHLFASGGPATQPAESLFDHNWALTLMEATMRRLREEYATAGQQAAFELLKPGLTAARGETDYDTLAAALETKPASARSAMHRLRKRFREIFRTEVAGTVATPGEVDDEMRAVIAALGSA